MQFSPSLWSRSLNSRSSSNPFRIWFTAVGAAGDYADTSTIGHSITILFAGTLRKSFVRRNSKFLVEYFIVATNGTAKRSW